MKQVRLNKKFYPKENVDRAMNAFGEAALFNIVEKEDFFLVDIEKKQDVVEDEEAVAREFANHCLAQSR